VSKYRRIEINAYHRKVTVVSGEWRPGDVLDTQPGQTEKVVSLEDADSRDPVEPDSPDGQLILIEAVHFLEQRLSPESRRMIRTDQASFAPTRTDRAIRFLKLRSFVQYFGPGLFRSD
jgi:hypothetical protein